MSRSGAASVVGWGESYATESDPQTPLGLAAEASAAAFDRAGIEKGEIEGLFFGFRPMADPRSRYNNIFSSHLNMTPTLSSEITFHLPGVVSMLKYAAMAVEAGVADPILCVQSDAIPTYTDPAEEMAGWDVDPIFESPYGLIFPAVIALVARRQLAERGITRRDMAEVAVAEREWGREHPHATMGDEGELTVADVLESPPIATPLGLLDCVPWSDAGTGGAFVVTASDNAASYDGQPVEILGFGEYSTHEYVTHRPSLKEADVGKPSSLLDTGASVTSRRAYEMAGIGPDDVDVAEVTHLFSNVALLMLEELGFCETGRAGAFVAEGGLRPSADGLAFNTHGGDLTFGQPGVSIVMNAILECVRQLTGEALGRQVPDARRGLVHACGSSVAAHSTAILGVER